MRVPGLVDDKEEDQLKTSPNLMEVLRKDTTKRKEITKERGSIGQRPNLTPDTGLTIESAPEPRRRSPPHNYKR